MKFPTIPIPNFAKKAFWTVARKARKNKPEICLIGGFVAGGVAIVYAAVETWRNKDKLSADADRIKYLRTYDPEEEAKKNPDGVLICEEERVRQLHAAYFTMGRDIFIAYWKPLLSGTTSAILFVTSHRSLRRQLGEMAAAYTAIYKAYKSYRNNVIADAGIEKDQEYAYGIKMEERVDADTGEVRKVPVAHGKRLLSPYARWLDEGDFDGITGRWIWKNKLWDSDKHELALRLRSVQNELNDILTAQGYLFLNTAYYKLGFPLTKEGQHVGWVRGEGDSFVDLGIFPDYMNGKFQLPVNKSFLDLRSNQRHPLVEFNVDGCIDYIFDDICEYDNQSLVVYDKRAKLGGIERSREHLDRWFRHNDLVGNM